MSQALRQLVVRARGALGLVGQWSTSAQGCCSAGALEARPITSLLSLRSFTQQTQPAAAAAAVATPPPLAQRPALPPWTPTRELVKRKVLTKRMGHLLQVLEREKEEEALRARPVPDFGPGDTVELRMSIPENKRRSTTFKGIVIARRNRGVRSSFTLRALVGALGGVERTFPLHSPHVAEIRVLDRKSPPRAKLYYLRRRVGKEHRVD
eukprot:scaffold8.g1358.t1